MASWTSTLKKFGGSLYGWKFMSGLIAERGAFHGEVIHDPFASTLAHQWSLFILVGAGYESDRFCDHV
jgi:hypothetical protein